WSARSRWRAWLDEPVSRRVTAPSFGRIVGRRGAAAPGHAVGDRALDLRLVVDRVLLVAGAEVRDASCPAVVAATAAKDLPALERADENQLIRSRDVEELAVHLVVRDHDRLRKACCDRAVHSVRVDPLDRLLAALVDVFVPDGNAQPAAGRHQIAAAAPVSSPAGYIVTGSRRVADSTTAAVRAMVPRLLRPDVSGS